VHHGLPFGYPPPAAGEPLPRLGDPTDDRPGQGRAPPTPTAATTSRPTAPDGPFVNWTIANYANRLELAAPPYAHAAPWRVPRGGVTLAQQASSFGGGYVWRGVRDLAADYVKYSGAPPGGASSMVVYLKDVDDWSKVVVSVILVSSSEEFIELVQPSPQTVQGEPGTRRYEVDSTSFGYAVVVITNIDAGGAGEGREDDYRTRYSIKAVWE